MTANRRNFLYSSALGFIAAAGVPSLVRNPKITTTVSDRYPAIPLDSINKVVSASHSDLDKVMELVNERPELANATWDWGWGDIESALGAASHMGRKDIAEFLISKGARQDLFSMVMMGQLEASKAVIKANPGIQGIPGPHGISLLRHAKARLRWKDKMSTSEIQEMEEMIEYLGSFDDADLTPERMMMDDSEKEGYVGDYKFGEGPRDVLVVKKNRRGMLSLARKGEFGKGMYKVSGVPPSSSTFKLESIPSISVEFIYEDKKVIEILISEPDFRLKGVKIS